MTDYRTTAEAAHLRWRRERVLTWREQLMDRGDRIAAGDTFGDPAVIPYAVALARLEFDELTAELVRIDRRLEYLTSQPDQAAWTAALAGA